MRATVELSGQPHPHPPAPDLAVDAVETDPAPDLPVEAPPAKQRKNTTSEGAEQ